MLTALAAAILIFLGYIYFHNRLAAARNSVATGYSGILVQLKRRHELVPALVQSVRSALHQESQVFDRILDVREKAVGALQMDQKAVEAAEADLSASLRKFFGYAEDHPEITSTGNVRELQKQLEETEDQISAARRLYNGNVERFNTMLDSIPTNWIGRSMRLERAELFTLSEAEVKTLRSMPPIDLPGAQS
ncbi:LemA family protein [Amorphus orientalis]|uniref:LemA protein n=1 Tax=Amorphus orientalis TaxID=649198 RepID=A0AAE3VMI2_9HYPH|nr:LemA family protein [Amorphus orientalis]MDQ0314690.1 LemA protein [Amorphus orientalis]